MWACYVGTVGPLVSQHLGTKVSGDLLMAGGFARAIGAAVLLCLRIRWTYALKWLTLAGRFALVRLKWAFDCDSMILMLHRGSGKTASNVTHFTRF